MAFDSKLKGRISEYPRRFTMTETIFLILFIVLFFPFLLLKFQKIHKAQQEIIELLRETNRTLAGTNEKD
jgi:flagellar biogenesis protein FliO